MGMNARCAWVLGAALAATGAFADTDPTVKLDPERPSGSVPIALDHLENYTSGMLISYLELVSKAGDATSMANAARVAAHLSQTDPNWRVSAATQFAARATAAASTRARTRLRKADTGGGTAPTSTPTPAPTATPTSGGSTVAAEPSTTPSPAASVAAPAPTPTAVATAEPEAEIAAPTPAPTRVARVDWSSFAEDQMRSFWTADRDGLGATPNGYIRDPLTGQLKKLDDHQKAVGMQQAFSDELTNTVNPGTMKRIKDN